MHWALNRQMVTFLSQELLGLISDQFFVKELIFLICGDFSVLDLNDQICKNSEQN
jgi:hypothetical protein